MVLQQTPLAVIAEPPSDKTVPPELALNAKGVIEAVLTPFGKFPPIHPGPATHGLPGRLASRSGYPTDARKGGC